MIKQKNTHINIFLFIMSLSLQSAFGADNPVRNLETHYEIVMQLSMINYKIENIDLELTALKKILPQGQQEEVIIRIYEDKREELLKERSRLKVLLNDPRNRSRWD